MHCIFDTLLWKIDRYHTVTVTILLIYVVFSHLNANISKKKKKNGIPYRVHIGSLKEKLRRDDDDLMTSACSFNGEKYRTYGMSSFFTDLSLLTFSRKFFFIKSKT